MTRWSKAGALIAAATLFLTQLPVEEQRAQAADPPNQIAFGAFPQVRNGQTRTQATLALEAQIGRKLEVVRVFETWQSPFPDSFHRFLRDGDRVPILSIKPIRSNGTRVTWPSMVTAQPGSTVYNEMASWATRIRDYGGQIYVTLHHEPEASSSLSYGTATDFIAAWRRWVDLFRELGVTNARFMWIMTDYAFMVPPSDRRHGPKWFPGAAWVDHMGIDAYNWATCRPNVWNPWKSLEEIIEPFRRFGLQYPDIPLWLTEWASWEDPNSPGRKGAWFDQARTLFTRDSHRQFAGLAYFNASHPGTSFPDCQWWVDTSASSLARFAAMANDPYYQGDGWGEAPNTPPTASITVGCADQVCGFDGSASTDADGSIVSYAWNFGDGASATGATAEHAYAFGGVYTVTLVVTDNRGATGTATTTVEVSGSPPPNEPPTAAFTHACIGLACTFDGSSSSDPEGPIASHTWDFGDGGAATGATTSWTFAAPGTYGVTLAVTDRAGATASTVTRVTVGTPLSTISFVGAAASNRNATSHSVTTPSQVQAGDGLLLFASVNSATGTLGTPSGVTGWQQLGTVTSGTMVTRVWRKVAAAGDAGRAVNLVVSPTLKVNLVVAAYRGTSGTDPVESFTAIPSNSTSAARTAPTVTVPAGGRWVVGYWAHKDNSTAAFIPPPGVVVRSNTTQSGSGRVTGLLADPDTAVPPGPYSPGTATAATASSSATMWSIVLAPG